MATEKRYYRLCFTLFILWSIILVYNSCLHAAEPVKMALILAQTGIAAEENIPAIQAARLAAEEINSEGGLLGHPVEIIIIDNKSTPLGSKAAAQQAIDSGVTAVVGAFRSSHSLPMAYVLQTAKIPMITPSSTSPEITLVGDYIFRTCFVDLFQGRVMAEFAAYDLGAKGAVVLTNASERYSVSLSDYFRAFFVKCGGKILWTGTYNGNAVDFKDLLSQIVTLSPDVVFVPGYSRDTGLLINQAAKMGIRTVYMGGDAWGNQIVEYAGDALSGSYYSAHWHPDVPFERNNHLKKMLKEKYGIEHIDNMRIPLTYDSLWLLAGAVKKAGSIDRSRVRNALSETEGFKGATGIISFDENGDPMNKEVSILKFENGSWKFIKSKRPQ